MSKPFHEDIEKNDVLEGLTKEELHRIESIMGHMNLTKELRSAIGSREAQREDYWLKMITEQDK